MPLNLRLHCSMYLFHKCLLRDHPFKTLAYLRGEGVKNLPNLPTDSTKLDSTKKLLTPVVIINVRCKRGLRSKYQSKFWICYWFNLSTIRLSLFLGGNEAVNNTMHQQLPASSYAGLPHAPTIQQVNNLGPVNPEPQSPINPALMAQPNQQQMQVKLRHY